MSKLYVSCPTQGKGRVEILTEQEYVLNKVRRKLGSDVELMSALNHKYAEMAPLESLGHSLIVMAGADYVAFGRGWEDDRACVIEHQCAEAFEVPIVDWSQSR